MMQYQVAENSYSFITTTNCNCCNCMTTNFSSSFDRSYITITNLYYFVESSRNCHTANFDYISCSCMSYRSYIAIITNLQV